MFTMIFVFMKRSKNNAYLTNLASLLRYSFWSDKVKINTDKDENELMCKSHFLRWIVSESWVSMENGKELFQSFVLYLT